MANSFVDNSYVKLFIANIIDAMPYLKRSKSHFAGELKGKKGGEVYNFVLRDSGKPTSGLAVTGSDRLDVKEGKIWLAARHKKSVVALNILESVVDIYGFKEEIADPYGLNLGAEIQKDAIDESYFDGCVAKVATSNGWTALSSAIAHQRSARNGAKLCGFLSPEAEDSLTTHSLNNWHFGSNELVDRFYKEGAVGMFHGTEFAYVNDAPVVTVPSGGFSNITVSAGANVAAPTTSLSGAVDRTVLTVSSLSQNIPAGVPFTMEGAYACDSLGRKTRALFSFITQEAAKSGDTQLVVQRLRPEDCGSRNVSIPGVTDVASIAGTLVCQLAANTSYEVAQIRCDDVMNWDNIPLDDIAQCENTSATFGGVNMHVAKGGDWGTAKNSTRWDVGYLTGIVDNRLVSLAYMPVV